MNSVDSACSHRLRGPRLRREVDARPLRLCASASKQQLDRMPLRNPHARVPKRIEWPPMNRLRRKCGWFCLAVAAAGHAVIAAQDYKTWKDYGGGADNSHFVDLRQINKSNVNQLEVAWIYPTGDQRSYVFN